MSDEARDRCPICGSDDLSRSGAPYRWGELLRCLICEHVMVTRSSQPFLENRDRQLQFFGEVFAYKQAWLNGVYDDINARRTAKILAPGRHQKIIEIGPGQGVVMAHMSAKSHEVQGLDLSQSVSDVIRKRYGLRVVVEDLAEFSLREAGLWDAAVMRHVLEHFEDPISALKNVSILLRAGGRLYVAVPNMDSWHRRWRGWSGFEPYHLQYFGRKSLTQCIGIAGLTIVRMGSYESLTGWTNTVLRSIRRQNPSVGTIGIPPNRGGAVRQLFEVTRLTFGLLSSPVRWTQSWLGRGEELFAVAQKTIADK